MTRCAATWGDFMGRHRCCRFDGHEGPHAKSAHPDEVPVPAVPELKPALSSAAITRLARGKR